MNKFKYGNKFQLFIVTLALFVSASFNGITLYFLRDIADYALESNVAQIIYLSKILLIVITVEFIYGFLVVILEANYLKNSVENLKINYVSKLFKLDLENRSKQQHLSHLTNDMDNYEVKHFKNILKLIRALSGFLVSLILLLSVSVKLFVGSLILSSLFLFFVSKSNKPIQKQENIKSKSLLKYTNYIKESILGFYIIKQNTLEIKSQNQFKTLAQTVADDNFELDKTTTKVDALNSFIQTFVIFTIITLGLLFTRSANVSLGNILLVGTAFLNSFWPIQQLTPLLNEILGISVIIENFDLSLKETPELASDEINKIDEITFSNVSFAYSETLVLEAVNLNVKAGEKVLLVGKSGAGKSTILKSLRKQLKPKVGNILINGLDISDVTFASYLKNFAIIDQIGIIFSGSVKENISLYQKCDNQVIIKLLKQVDLADLNLNDKLNNNGSNISGGQRARLLLARALFLQSDIVVSDEIFASLDLKVASDLEKSLLTYSDTYINVSHIIFEDNFKLYDKVFLVDNMTVSKVENFDDLKALGLILN